MDVAPKFTIDFLEPVSDHFLHILIIWTGVFGIKYFESTDTVSIFNMWIFHCSNGEKEIWKHVIPTKYSCRLLQLLLTHVYYSSTRHGLNLHNFRQTFLCNVPSFVHMDNMCTIVAKTVGYPRYSLNSFLPLPIKRHFVSRYFLCIRNPLDIWQINVQRLSNL